MGASWAYRSIAVQLFYDLIYFILAWLKLYLLHFLLPLFIWSSAGFFFLSCSSFLRFFFCKTPAKTQQVLPVQTGLYRHDE